MERRSLRRVARTPAEGKVVLAWTDEHGWPREIRGRCVDVSELGLQVQSPDPIPVQAYVCLRTSQLPLNDFASVRYCRSSGVGYRIGLEFSDRVNGDG